MDDFTQQIAWIVKLSQQLHDENLTITVEWRRQTIAMNDANVIFKYSTVQLIRVSFHVAVGCWNQSAKPHKNTSKPSALDMLFFFETECLVFFPWNWIFHFDQSNVVHTMGPYSSCKIQRKMEAVCIIMIKWARKDETCVTSVSRIHRLITNNISGHWKCALLVCVVEVFIFFFSFLCVLVFFFYIFVYKIMCIRLNWTRYVSLCPWNAGGMYSLNSMHRASVFELVVSACMCRIF